MKKRRLLVVVGALIVLGGAAFYWIGRGKTPPTTNPAASTTQDNKYIPQKEVTAVVQKYVQARENRVGDNHHRPTDWLLEVQTITTPGWFATLQPSSKNPTGNASAEYYTAHDNHYVVKARVSGCMWDVEDKKPTATSGDVYCDLTDTTYSSVSDQEVPSGQLPFGWTHFGPQTPVVLEMVKQDGKWLVNEDATGQG